MFEYVGEYQIPQVLELQRSLCYIAVLTGYYIGLLGKN
jgi:hypothetical protein